MLEDNDQPKKLNAPTWPAVRDLLAQIIIRAKGWHDADLIATQKEMFQHFQEAFPGASLYPSDLILALHDLNVPYERNEHNNKYYYLAKWL